MTAAFFDGYDDDDGDNDDNANDENSLAAIQQRYGGVGRLVLLLWLVC